jgi:hypothetical protein
MAQKTYYSLDQTGTQAAYYPTEDALWTQGPPINDPADQGVEYIGADQLSAPPAPRSLKDAEGTETWLDEIINGETSNGAYGMVWVNPEVIGPTGFGPWNDGAAVFETGHSQNVLSNPGSEQGWGMDPARKWAHYPHDDAPNPDRNMGQHLRNGQLPWVTANSALYFRTQLAWEEQWAAYKHRSPIARVVPVPPSVPYVQTVPTYGGGDVYYPGVDYPYDFNGIYPA